MRYQKLLLAALLSTVAPQTFATYPSLDAMLQNFAPDAPTQAPDLNALIISLNGLAPYPVLQQNAYLSLVPLADGSLRAAADAPMRQVLSVISERLLPVNPENESNSGYSAGDETTDKKSDPTTNDSTSSALDSSNTSNNQPSTSNSGDNIPDLRCQERIKGVWGQLLGDYLNQQTRDGLPGYQASVGGGIIGRDLYIDPNKLFGIAAGYQHARVNQEDVTGSFLTINRYQLTAYGRYHFCDGPLYLVGAVTLATDRYENSRYILVPPVSGIGYSVIANAEFSGWESNVYLENGYVFQCGNFRAIPKLVFMFSHLDLNSYEESDALALDLLVKYQDMNEMMVGGGLKLDYLNEFEKASVVPEIHAYAFHDFMNDAQIATAQFFSGGYAFLSQGPAPAPNVYEVGASLAIHSYRNVVAKIQYDYTRRDDYYSHGGFLKVRYEWA